MKKVIGKEKVIDSWELEPVNGRKSFYGKAHCLETEKYWYLKSYETYMARVDKETKVLERLSDAKSMTTTTHLDSFFDFLRVKCDKNSFYKLNKVELETEDIEDDDTFIKASIAEMSRYVRNWDFMSAKERNNVMPGYSKSEGLAALKIKLAEAKARLKKNITEDVEDDEWYENFKKDYDGLHPEIKKRLADSGVMVHSKEQAEDLMKMSKAFSVMMSLCKEK